MTDKIKRGFSAMSPERQKEIASKGGKRAHELRTAHRWSVEEARAAGRKSHESGRAHQFTSEEAKAAGRKGGEIAAQRNRRSAEAAQRRMVNVSRDTDGDEAE